MAQNFDLTQTGPELQERIDQVFPNRDNIAAENQRAEGVEGQLEEGKATRAELAAESARATEVEADLQAQINAIVSDKNAPDEEDLTSINISGTNVIRLKDKTYNAELYSGLGRKYLRKNIIDGENILTPSMISEANTIYIIQYDYDLNADEITIPVGCVLKFEGGSLRNGSIKLNSTTVESNTKCFYNVTFSQNSVVKNDVVNLSWFCNDREDASDAFVIAGSIGNTIIVDLHILYLSKPVVFSNTKCVKGSSTGWSNTTITATNDFNSGGDDKVSALFVFEKNMQEGDGIFNLALSGNFRCNYGVYFKKYASSVQHCYLRYFVLSAIYIGGSENSDISYNKITYCGCGIIALSYSIYGATESEKTNLLKFDVSQPTGGNITELRIHHNYIVWTNYGIICNPLQLSPIISDNCISESSCYSAVLNCQRNLVFERNYIESPGISTFWVEYGMDFNQDLYPQTNQSGMCQHLLQSHEDLLGIEMEGWGIPVGNVKVRPSVMLNIISTSTVAICDNLWSPNQIRTAKDDSTISTTDSITGIDTILSVSGLGNVVFKRNRMLSGSTSPKYMIIQHRLSLHQVNPESPTTVEPSYPKLVLSEVSGNYNFDEYIDNFTQTDVIDHSCQNLEVIHYDDLSKKTSLNLVNSCGILTNYPRINPTTVLNLSKNVYNLAGANYKIIGNLPVFLLPEENGYNYVSRGIEYLSIKLNYNFVVSFRIYNDEEVVSNLTFAVRNLYDSLNPTFVKRSNLAVNSKEYKDFSFIINKENLEDYFSVYIQDSTSAAGSVRPESYKKIYASVVYITPVSANVDLNLQTDKVTELGISKVGDSSNRPTLSSDMVGFVYFDITLGKPIYWNGTTWLDAAGAPV